MSISLCDKILFVKISLYFSEIDVSNARVILEKFIEIKSINNCFKFLKTFYKKSSIWSKIIIFIILALIFTKIANANTPRVEGFSQSRKFVVKKNNNLYDDFYCSLYDDLMYDPIKNRFELNEIKHLTEMNKDNSVILDIGSGTGHHAKSLHKNNYDVLGLDKSESMVKYAKNKYPNIAKKIVCVCIIKLAFATVVLYIANT